MEDLDKKHELWGTFSVKDHRAHGAFLSEVILYDLRAILVTVSVQS